MTHSAGDLRAEVDVSRWTVIRDEPGGRDPNKRWIAVDGDAPRHEHWLWKARQLTGRGNEFAITDCSEVVASRLARWLGIPAADCRFALCDDALGVISRNVAPDGFSLNTARTYLPEVDGYRHLPGGADGPRGTRRMRSGRGYTLDAIEAILATVEPPPQFEGDSAFGVFSGYLVLDALVANTDRHPGNWALLESESDGRRFLAPTFDHGSALGAGLTDRNRRLTRPEAFAAKGRANPFMPERPLLIDLAHDAVRRTKSHGWMERVATLDAASVRAMLEAPENRLSDIASTFVLGVILENRRRLCDDNAAQD